MKIEFVKHVSVLNTSVIIVLDKELILPDIAEDIHKEIGVDLRQVLKIHKYKGKLGELLHIPVGSKKIRNVVLLGVGSSSEAKELELINAGKKLYTRLKAKAIETAKLYMSVKTNHEQEDMVLKILLGIMLGSYKFDKYKTKKDEEDEDENEKPDLKELSIISDKSNQLNLVLEKYQCLAESIAFTKDLISEPSNEKTPITLSKICSKFTKLGLKIEILDEEEIKALGMNAMIGVGQGSVIPPRLVIMKWDGLKDKEDTIALVGKGVTFDSGGLSIKTPSSLMETMKGDMGGAAVVIGVMRALALRKAKVNVVGVIGLAENMPSGSAQKPGDIVKTMSGQTIEILNTDAEGRLLLADVLWYTQDKFKPKVMIDFATLTGAMRIALGTKMAGLFSNNDDIADQLYKSGVETGERLWRLPLDKEYNKLIDSKIADVKNIAGPKDGAGSIVAAEFLQRFVNNTPWAHIDIAAVSDRENTVPSGFGVRLVDKFIEDYYEK